MTGGRRILVLGGGVGGLVVANALRKRLPPRHEVVLVSRDDTFVFAPSLLWVMVGARRAEQISRPLRRLAHRGVTLRIGEIARIDPVAREIEVGGQTLAGDVLVIALGAATAPDSIPGLADGGHDLYSLAGALVFRDQLASLRGGRIVVLTAAPAYRCPAAPYEAAMLTEAACRKRGTGSRVRMFTAEPGPMGVAGPEVSAAVRGMVESKGIEYQPSHQVTRADAATRTLHFSNGATANWDRFVPPHLAPAVVTRSGLGDASVDPGGSRTLETRFPNVYAVGDVN